LILSFTYAADINEKLYDENNSSFEIRKIRALISNRKPADEEEQNIPIPSPKVDLYMINK
jgi:hypothetical protein